MRMGLVGTMAMGHPVPVGPRGLLRGPLSARRILMGPLRLMQMVHPRASGGRIGSVHPRQPGFRESGFSVHLILMGHYRLRQLGRS